MLKLAYAVVGCSERGIYLSPGQKAPSFRTGMNAKSGTSWLCESIRSAVLPKQKNENRGKLLDRKATLSASTYLVRGDVGVDNIEL